MQPGENESRGWASAEVNGGARGIVEPKPTPPLDQNFAGPSICYVVHPYICMADLVVRAHPHFVVADPNQDDCPIIFASDGFLTLTGDHFTVPWNRAI